jgi:hypothetical protein
VTRLLAALLCLLLATACDVLVETPLGAARGLDPAPLAGDWVAVPEPPDDPPPGVIRVGRLADRLLRVDFLAPGEGPDTYFVGLHPGAEPGAYWGLAARRPGDTGGSYLFHLRVEGPRALVRLPDRERARAWLRASALPFRVEETPGPLRVETLRILAPWPDLLSALRRDRPEILGQGYALARTARADGL